MNFFCRIFGHTWVPETRAPRSCWTTTKAGHVLEGQHGEESVRHLDVCRRCGEERDLGELPHDKDSVAAAAPSAE